MASAAQVAANRENAKRPRTLSAETKESLRTRALKHGLATKLDTNTVLRGENKQEFENILTALLTEATLGAPQEILLINLQAQSYWKLQRAARMETGALETSLIAAQLQDKVARNLKDGVELGSALAFALREQAAWFETLRRYSAAAERSFFKATRELAMIRKSGPQEPIGCVPQAASPEETKAPPAEIGPPQIGDVPQPLSVFDLPAAQPRPELGGMSQFAFLGQLETMSETEAFEFLDKLTAPPAIPPTASQSNSRRR